MLSDSGKHSIMASVYVDTFPFGLDMSLSKLSAICWMRLETVTGTLSSLLSFVYLATAEDFLSCIAAMLRRNKSHCSRTCV